jgi:hypothetical protein
MTQQEQLEAILDAHAEYYIKQTMKFFQEGTESPALSRNNKGDLTAKSAITALIQEASNGGRVDELLYLANSADPLILDRTWIQNRIRELTNSGGSNNE